MDNRAVSVDIPTDNNALRNGYGMRNGYAMSNNAMRNDDDVKPCVSLEKSLHQDTNAMRNSYALRKDDKTVSKITDCVHCGTQFERRTTWHKYCSELCKIKAYELRTGKKWKGKVN
jgi:hypothetical protein